MQVQLAASILSSLFTFHSIWKLLTIIEQKSKIAQNLYYKNPSVSLVAATSLEREAFIVFQFAKASTVRGGARRAERADQAAESKNKEEL